MSANAEQALIAMLHAIDEAPPGYVAIAGSFSDNDAGGVEWELEIRRYIHSDATTTPPSQVDRNRLGAIRAYTKYIVARTQRQHAEARSREAVAAIVHHQPAPVVETEDEP